MEIKNPHEPSVKRQATNFNKMCRFEWKLKCETEEFYGAISTSSKYFID